MKFEDFHGVSQAVINDTWRNKQVVLFLFTGSLEQEAGPTGSQDHCSFDGILINCLLDILFISI